MKNFLSSTMGKVIAGVATLAAVAAIVTVVVLINMGYRTIRVDDLVGTTVISKGSSFTEAVMGQNLKSGCDVEVQRESSLTLALDEDKHVYAQPLTRFSLKALGKAGKDSRTIICLDKGSILSEIDEKLAEDESYVVESPNATMAVRGTSFTVTVYFDEEGFCHTLVEVTKGMVEVTEKDEKGKPTDNVQTLEAGEATEIISLVAEDNNNELTPNGGDSPIPLPAPEPGNPEFIINGPMEIVYQNPEALAVEEAIEAYLNGGTLETTNLDRVTKLDICGKVVFAELDNSVGGKARSHGMSFTSERGKEEVHTVSYSPNDDVDPTIIETENSNITDLSFITEMQNLRELTIQFGNITDITAISKLKHLTNLNLNFNKISDISPLKNSTKLVTLYLDSNRISDISPISGMTNLNCLSLNSNELLEIKAVSGLTSLTSLFIDDNHVSDLSPIKELKRISNLSFSNTDVSDISPIEGLNKITHLTMGNNKISDISPLKKLDNLVYISISMTDITDLSPIYGLSKLESINAYGISEDAIAKFKQQMPDVTIWN